MKRSYSLLLVLAVLGLTLFFRAIYFLHEGPTYYELATFDLARMSPLAYLANKEVGLVPPFYYIPALLFAHTGSEPWLPRIFSLLCGLIAPFVLFRVVYLAFENRILAWSAAIFLAVNPMHVIASSTMTPDSLGIIFTCLAILTFFRTGSQKRIDWLLFALCCLLLLHTHAGAPWVVATFFICHMFYALSINKLDVLPGQKRRLISRILFYYFFIAIMAAPWRIRMDSWVPWHVDYASFWPTVKYMLTVPFFGTNEPETLYSRVIQALIFIPLLGCIPIALRASRLPWLPIIGCLMSIVAFYGYVQIDRTYFIIERDAPLVLPFFILLLITLIGCIPWKFLRFPAFLAVALFFAIMSVNISTGPARSIWREISQVIKVNLGPKTVVAFWPNFTRRFVAYDLYDETDRLHEATNLISDLDEPARNRDVLFVLTDGYSENSKHKTVFAWPGAIASNSTATLTWAKDNNMIIHARDIEWANLRTWVANPIRFAPRDTPEPDITEFIYTPSNLNENPLEDDPGKVFDTPDFAWETPELMFDANGQRTVWNITPSFVLNLPVCLQAGQYVIKARIDSNLRTFGTEDTTRTVIMSMGAFDKITTATVDRPMTVELPFECDKEIDNVSLMFQTPNMMKTKLPDGKNLGLKFFSVRIDKNRNTPAEQTVQVGK